ncbi:hypothetical protein [Streptomyces sp. PTD5-9]|uniref:hypothetical protein n=1 Tax=Streptomyces sp. PTD5-9 TaxID=3120150 RepID=UPI00300BDED1
MTQLSRLRRTKGEAPATGGANTGGRVQPSSAAGAADSPAPTPPTSPGPGRLGTLAGHAAIGWTKPRLVALNHAFPPPTPLCVTEAATATATIPRAGSDHPHETVESH